MNLQCENCTTTVDNLVKVKGYWVCGDCEAQHYLPAHLRSAQ